jgi:hypothetical protein
MVREREMSEKEAFKVEYKGFIVTAFWNDDPKVQDANIVVTRDGAPYKEFTYPAYRIFNIAAHWSDLVEGELRELAVAGAAREQSVRKDGEGDERYNDSCL